MRRLSVPVLWITNFLGLAATSFVLMGVRTRPWLAVAGAFVAVDGLLVLRVNPPFWL